MGFLTKSLFLIFTGFFYFCTESTPLSSPHVVFLNPSIPTSAFFQPVTSIMTAAADDLGVNLEVVYANRNPLTLLQEGKKILAREKKPDYLVLVNDKDKIPLLLKLAEKSGIKTVLFNGPLSKANFDKFTIGDNRLKNWIGGIFPDDELAGFNVAQTLVEKARKENLYAEDGKIHIVGINGNHRSHSPIMREKGLKRFISENDNVVLDQIVYAYWSQEKAQKITEKLLQRYPKTSVVWSASDEMALGAISGANKLGYHPGKNLLSCGVDWLPVAFEDIENGNLSCSVGGHLFDGAWLMVLLIDHYNKKTPYFLNKKTKFYITNKDSLGDIKKILSPNFWHKFDYKQFSQTYGNSQPNEFGVHLIMERL